MIGIYKVINNINGKIYIGKSKDIYRRWREHHTEPFNQNCDAYNVIFYKAIRKYGIENFSFEVIEECDEALLNEREKYWIKKYQTYINDSNNGYNMTKGGEYTSQELKYDIELIEQLWEKGKTHQEISNITGYNPHIITRYLDYLQIDANERRQRGALYKAKAVHQYDLTGKYIKSFNSISEAVREISKEYSKASTSNISYACNGKISSAYGYIWSYTQDKCIEKKVKRTKVNQYDLFGHFIATFNTQTEAIKAIGIKNTSSISNVCNGRSKTAGGYIWRYYDASLENPTADLTNINEHKEVH